MSRPPQQHGFIPTHGNHRELLSYQKAEIVGERVTRTRLRHRQSAK